MFLATLTQEQKEAFICLAHNVVVSDGDLTVGEKLMMVECMPFINSTKPKEINTIMHYIFM